MSELTLGEMGRSFMTGRIHYTLEAERQLNELDEWITEQGTAIPGAQVVAADHGVAGTRSRATLPPRLPDERFVL
ncbi:hypothetical protein ACQBAU_01635 [Propionibacteriaceae bacterium Y2011]